MNKIKKTFFLITKTVLALVFLLTVILFFYAGHFYDATKKEVKENKDIKEEKLLEEEEIKEAEVKEQEKEISKQEETINEPTENKTEVKQVITSIEDGLFITVGNRAITKSDIVNEIKIILILNNESYSDANRDRLQEMAIKSTIARNIKQIEIDKNSFLEFNQRDLMKELTRLANRINVDVDTLKNICSSNELDFSLIENQVKTELLWNSLIFQLYKNRLSINIEEIEEQLNLIRDRKELEEYLISEIVIKPVEKNKLKSEIDKLKNKIEVEGFEQVAMNLSISETAVKGGDLGWLNENIISKKYISKISATPIGNISEPVFLPEGILIFKIRDKRKIKRDIEEEKNQLVNSEKTKILKMHASSHYDKLKRSIAVKFLNE